MVWYGRIGYGMVGYDLEMGYIEIRNGKGKEKKRIRGGT
jgi:hypothetical protein